MDRKLLFTEGNYTIWREPGIPPEAFSFLNNMKWGNEGAVYEHKNTAEHIQLIPNPTLLSVRAKAEICPLAILVKYFCF